MDTTTDSIKKDVTEEKQGREDRAESGHFCGNCGSKVKATDKFCPVCGKRVNKRMSKRRRIFLLIFLVLVSIGIGLLVFSMKAVSRRAPSDLKKLTSALVEAFVAKSIGDDIVGGRLSGPTAPTFADVNASINKAERILNETADNPYLGNYRGEVKKFVSSIKQNAQVKNPAAISDQERANWKSVPQGPSVFQLSVGNDTKSKSLQDIASQLSRTSEFGNAAVTLNNAEDWRYVYARLQADSQWLQNINNDNASKVCASEDAQVCLDDLLNSIDNLRDASFQNMTGVPGAAEKWKEAYGKLPLDIKDYLKDNVGKVETIGGVTVFGAASKEFVESCVKRGGKLKNDEHVKLGLPTNENGFTCWSENDKKSQCWDFLTFSGALYKGGDESCEQLGVIDVKIQENPNFDGTYVQRYRYDCSITASGQTQTESKYEASGFVVKGDKAADTSDGEKATVSKDGVIKISSDEPGASGSIVINLIANDDGSVEVQGSLEVSVSGDGFSASCKGNITGERTSKSISDEHLKLL